MLNLVNVILVMVNKILYYIIIIMVMNLTVLFIFIDVMGKIIEIN